MVKRIFAGPKRQAPIQVISSNEEFIRFGKLLIPEQEGTNHFAIVGSTGSGKTTLLRLLLQSILPRIANRDSRALIYDAKQDALPILSGIVDPETVVTMNPFDTRGRSWDISKDINEPRIMEEFCQNLIPPRNESQPFFTDASRNLMYGVLLSYFLSGFSYSLGDILRALRSKHLLYQILQRHAATRHLVENYLENPKLASNLMPSVGTSIQPFESIAACWDHAEKSVAIRDWSKKSYTLVLGNSEVSRSSIDSINRCIFKRASDVTLDQSESKTRRTWFVLDELADAGKLPGLISLAKKGRSKGACIALAFQSISGLRDQSLYGKYGTDELMGQIGTRFIGRLECVSTAEYISQLIGEQEYVAESTSYTSAKESSTTRNYSVQVRKAVLPGTLLDLKPCSQKNGLTGFCITRSLGTFRTHIDGNQLFDVDLGSINESVPAFDPRPAIQQILQPWTEDEATKFGVDLHFRIPRKTPTTKPEASPKKRRSKSKTNPIADPLEGLFE